MNPTKYPVQIIGDRRIINPRTKTVELKDRDGNTFDTVIISLEVCGCGYSQASQGVGYRADTGWLCKRCNQLHTTDNGKIRAGGDCLTPDPDMVEEFDQRSTQPPPSTCSTAADLRAEQARRSTGAPRILATAA